MKKFVSLLLALVMLFSISTTAFASMPPSQANDETVTVDDNGIYINGSYYTKEQFISLLNTAQTVEVKHNNRMRAAAVAPAVGLIAGTWYIPGIGQIIVTAAGTILIAGAVVAVGSWVYNAVVEWFAKKAFNDSAKKALDNVPENKQYHILHNNLHKNGHNWKNIFNGRDPNWNQLKVVLLKVFEEGVEHSYDGGNVFERELLYNGVTVVVRFVKAADGTVQYFGTAYLK